MGLFDRFFGNADKSKKLGEQLVANPATDKKLSFQLLFPAPVLLQSGQLQNALRKYDDELSRARCEIDPGTAEQGTPIGLAGWSNHVVQIVGFNVPMPAEAVEKCVQPSHYQQDLKDRARAHQAHVLLYYAGYEKSVLEQYVALAAVAGALAELGAIVVVNESAFTSFPAAGLAAENSEGDSMMDLLRSLPLLILYCGFVKYDVEDTNGVWMRTYGNHLLGLPDLARLAGSHSEGTETFDIFCNVLNYLLESGAKFAAGHTMQVGDDLFMRLREPAKDEYFLHGPGQTFVAEMISADEINR